MLKKQENLFMTSLKYRNFRNYSSFDLIEIQPLTIFIGKNAVGKTNILEGIQLLTTQTSFRNSLTSELITFEADSSSLQAQIINKNRDLALKMNIIEGKRKYLLNEKAKSIQELKGFLPSVMFSPDDLHLIKGSNSPKRAAFDEIGSQISSNYYVIKKDYEKVIHHKNQLLKDNSSLALLDSINETLLKVGTQLFCYRYSLYQKFSQIFSKLYPHIVDVSEEVFIDYIPSWNKKNEFGNIIKEDEISKEKVKKIFQTALEQNQTEEIKRKRTIIGPHADAIDFYINNKNARTYGSQGQQRSLVLCFKLTEVKLIQEILHQQPILLLDDVMSELDEQRRAALLNFISDDIQTFITATTLQYFNQDILEKASVVKLPINTNHQEKPISSNNNNLQSSIKKEIS